MRWCVQLDPPRALIRSLDRCPGAATAASRTSSPGCSFYISLMHAPLQFACTKEGDTVYLRLAGGFASTGPRACHEKKKEKENTPGLSSSDIFSFSFSSSSLSFSSLLVFAAGLFFPLLFRRKGIMRQAQPHLTLAMTPENVSLGNYFHTGQTPRSL